MEEYCECEYEESQGEFGSGFAVDIDVNNKENDKEGCVH